MCYKSKIGSFMRAQNFQLFLRCVCGFQSKEYNWYTSYVLGGTWYLWKRHMACKMSYVSFPPMQGRLAWIGLWRQLLSITQVFANLNFFKVQVHSTRLDTELTLNLKIHKRMWCFHKYCIVGSLSIYSFKKTINNLNHFYTMFLGMWCES